MPFILSAPARHEADIRKSRFLALAAAIKTPQEAEEFFASARDPQATHNCWAWKIGSNYRFNDDGEPGGTAGRPILQAIESQDCDQVAVLVIRWYGGIKLGTGGLARAYGGTSAECLRLAEKKPILDELLLQCSSNYADMDRIAARLQSAGAEICSAQYDATGVSWQLRILRSELAEFERLYADLTRGQGQFSPIPPESA